MDTHEAVAKVDQVLRRLNGDPGRLSDATRGQSVRLLLVLTDPHVEIRIVVMSDGTAVRVTDEGLLGQGFTPQMTVLAASGGESDPAEGGIRLTSTIHDSALASDLEAVRQLLTQCCGRPATA